MAEDYTARATCECYYKFENSGDMGEDNQNQIDLTNSGVAQSATIPSGTYADPSAGNSADFESGNSDYLHATHAVSTEIDDITAVTVVGWFKLDSVTGVRHWVNKSAEPTATGWFFRAAANYEQFKFQAINHEPYAQVFTTGVWYFIAETYDGDRCKFYFGTEEGQVVVKNDADVTNSVTAATTAGFTLGARDSLDDLFFDGLMCEVAVFSEALSLSDIEDIQQYGIEGTAVAELNVEASECE